MPMADNPTAAAMWHIFQEAVLAAWLQCSACAEDLYLE